ncbi:SMP-30/gluconolactonase/LRE family protein [Salinimonas sp. HHU 13199]|uniref:SMP-30/gluconolactonase/LRE family protein n=1 Tax=Salinimonas profundi TaxID=2729140 RepID=A0ABR8LL34_9ALTE|nr:SMP-30/gluconolactonase/LRE family protein [Salinimonas profundi]MBD3586904.1 SMP-30/gluconolactonase/LRE family protein [Salinimonas profundi]
MVNVDLVTVFNSQCELGEGAYYSQLLQCVFWVDIYGCKIYALDWQSQQIKVTAVPEPVCWIKETDSGLLIAGFASGIYTLDKYLQPQSLLWQLPQSEKHNRLNDAKVDRHGNLYFGTMDRLEQRNSGNLYRLCGTQSAQIVDAGYVVSNGPAFNPAGSIIYSVSSKERIIYAINVDQAQTVTSKRIHIQLRPSQGHPDGITVDTNGCLWVCAWDGHAVLRFNPDGDLIQTIRLPVPRVTSVTFAGPDLDHIFVTSARTGLDEKACRNAPDSGNTFVFKTGARGIPDKRVNL